MSIDEAKLKELGLESRMLFTTSSDAWEVPFHRGNLTKEDLVMPEKDKRKTYPLAVMIQGQFPDAFEGSLLPEWPKEDGEETAEESYEKPEEQIELNPAPGKLILIGCATTFNKELFDKGGQLAFFLNSVDALTLGEALIEVRSKQPVDRSLKKISSTAKAGWKLLTTILFPLALCAIGGLRIFVRKRSKWSYLKSL